MEAPKTVTTQVDFDSSAIKGKLNELKSSEKLSNSSLVSDWLVELSIDSSDSEVVWVWAYLKEEEIFEYKNYNKRKSLEDSVIAAIKEMFPDVSVYVHFRSDNEKEYAEAEAEAEDEDEDEDEV